MKLTNAVIFGKTLILSLGLLSEPRLALGVLNIQTAIGARKLSNFTGAFSRREQANEVILGRELTLSIHFDPFAGVPVAFGCNVAVAEFYQDSSYLFFKKMKGQEWGGELMVWSPYRLFGLQVYGQASYTLAGDYDRYFWYVREAALRQETYRLSGSGLSLGLNISPWTTFALFLESHQGRYRLNAQHQFEGEPKSIAFISRSYLLGMDGDL